jgi:hypothetical protein
MMDTNQNETQYGYDLVGPCGSNEVMSVSTIAIYILR